MESELKKNDVGLSRRQVDALLLILLKTSLTKRKRGAVTLVDSDSIRG